MVVLSCVHSMEAVATAGVNRLTVYNQFGSRTALIEAVLDQVVGRDRMYRLQASITTTCAFREAERSLLRRLNATAYQDPAIAELLARRESWRRDQSAAVLAKSEDAPTRDYKEEAADVLTAVTSFPTYDRLGTSPQDSTRVADLLNRLTKVFLSAPR
jgi:AcrR family transcriptional regulator